MNKNKSTNNQPPLYGLVLAGGQSIRMGKDKGLIDWHGQPQRYYLADLLSEFCERVYISCREDQVKEIEQAGYKSLPDNSPAPGQFGAILSAQTLDANCAWLVVACDLPLLGHQAFQELVNSRDVKRLATAYKNSTDSLPEPLVAIWEPDSNKMLLIEYKTGIDCPRKALIHNKKQVKLILPANPNDIINTNTPKEAKTARKMIKKITLNNSRYSGQTNLPQFGKAGQEKLKKSRVLIVGAGGLGCPAALYLVSAGVGQLTLADFDKISPSNLHRQILFNGKDIGQFKAEVAVKSLKRHNPEIEIETITEKMTAKNVLKMIEPFDIVLDCTDNFDIRYILNDACVLLKKPLIYGGAYQYEGQVAVWNIENKDGTYSPNYRDVFPSSEASLSQSCSIDGVLPTLTGIIGCFQANEAIKYIVGLTGLLSSQLLIFNALTMAQKIIKLSKSTQVKIDRLPAFIPEISIIELKKGLENQEYTLIDVRSLKEHEKFNIGGDSIPLESILLNHKRFNLLWLNKLNKLGRPVVLYCEIGQKSIVAARYILKQNPQAQVYSLAGGLKGIHQT